MLAHAWLTDDDHVRLVHHLGVRYTGLFRDKSIVKFLTYDASTALNMFLANVSATTLHGDAAEPSPLLRAVKEGMGIPESAIVFSISPSNLPQSSVDIATVPSRTPQSPFSPGRRGVALATPPTFKKGGDIVAVHASSLDGALWKIGGAAVTLRLVQLANVRLSLLAV